MSTTDTMKNDGPLSPLIPNGRWQRITGMILFAIGLFFLVTLAGSDRAASDVASLCLAIGGPLLFWGLMLGYLNILERRVIWLIKQTASGVDERPD